MAPLFVTDSQIVARLSPFRSMRRDPAPTGPKLREEMRELVSQCALNFAGMKHKMRIQRDQLRAILRPARARFQSRIPFYPKFARNSRGAIGGEERARLRL